MTRSTTIRPGRTFGTSVGITLLGLIAITACIECAPGRGKTGVPMGPEGVLPGLLAAFDAKNPRIDRVWIEQVATTEPWPTRHGVYVVIAMGLETGAKASSSGGEFGLGQLFGVFVLDSAFTRVERVLHVFPTRRWLDYRVRFGEVDSDSITVLGEGETYGDERVAWRFDWIGSSRHEIGWPKDSSGFHEMSEDTLECLRTDTPAAGSANW